MGSLYVVYKVDKNGVIHSFLASFFDWREAESYKEWYENKWKDTLMLGGNLGIRVAISSQCPGPYKDKREAVYLQGY